MNRRSSRCNAHSGSLRRSLPLLLFFGAMLLTGTVCRADDLQIITIQTSGDQTTSFAPGVNDPKPAGPVSIHSLTTPMITPGGRIMYSATLSSDPVNDVLFDTRDSVWTATTADPATPQLQVRFGDTAPDTGWTGGLPPNDAPNPLFDGTGQVVNGKRLTAWGVMEGGGILFSAARFGIPETSEGLVFGQRDEHIVWQVDAGSSNVFQDFSEGAVVLHDQFSATLSGSVAVVVPNAPGPRELHFLSDSLLSSSPLAVQNTVPSQPGKWFSDSFATPGLYAFGPEDGIFFQTTFGTRNPNDQITSEGTGIWGAGIPGLPGAEFDLQKIVVEGDTYTLIEGAETVEKTLLGLRSSGGGDGYSLQATPEGDVGFLADGGIFLASSTAGIRNLIREDEQIRAKIDGRNTNVILNNFDDLLIGRDGTIYFEAETQIRQPPFKEANFLWRVDEDGVPNAIVQSGESAIEVDGPDILFDDRFNLVDANTEGQLVFRASLDRSHATVGSGNDDALYFFETDPLDIVPSGVLTLLAREGTAIPSHPEDAIYGVPTARRGAAISDDGTVAFRAADGGVFFEPKDDVVLLARFVIDDAVDFIWSGNCGSDNWHDDCGDSNWNDARSGSPAEKIPGAAGGAESVAINGADVQINDSTVELVDLRSLTATGSLRVERTLTLREESGVENLTISSDLNSSGGLTLSGTTNHAEGTLTVQDAILTSGPFNRYNIASGHVVASGLVSNVGTLSKQGIPDAPDGDALVQGEFQNEGGRIRVETGKLTLQGDGAHLGGSYVVSQGATLALSDGAVTVSGGSELEAHGDGAGNGVVELRNLTYTVVEDSTATFNLPQVTSSLPAVSNPGLLLNGVVLRADGLIENRGRATIRDGVLEGGLVVDAGDFLGQVFVGGFENVAGGTLFIEKEGEKSINGILQNNGRIEQENGATVQINGGLIVNRTGSTFQLNNRAKITAKLDGRFKNAGGTVRVSDPTDDTSIEEAISVDLNTPFDLSEGGRLIIDDRSLKLTAGGSHAGGGRIDLETGLDSVGLTKARLTLDGTHAFDGTFNIVGPGILHIIGQLQVNGGQLDLNLGGTTRPGKGILDTLSAVAVMDATAGKVVNQGDFEIRSGRITGGSLTSTGIENGFENLGGTLTIMGLGPPASATANTPFKDAVFRNSGGNGRDGMVNQNAVEFTLDNSSIVNGHGGIFQSRANKIINAGTTSRIINRGGTFRFIPAIPGGTGATTVAVPFDLESGEVQIADGQTVTMTNGGNSKGSGTVEIGKGAQLKLNGESTFAFDGDYQINGTGVFDGRGRMELNGKFTTNLSSPGKAILGNPNFDQVDSSVLFINSGDAEWDYGFLGSLQNTGKVTLNHGALHNVSGTLNNSGEVDHKEPVLVTLGSGDVIQNSGTYKLGGQLQGKGTFINQTNGKLIANAPTTQVRIPLENHGTIDVAKGKLTINRTLDNQGTIDVATDSLLTIDADILQTTVEITATSRLFSLTGGKWIARNRGRLSILEPGFFRASKSSAEIEIYGTGAIGLLVDHRDASSDFENTGHFSLKENASYTWPADFENNGQLAIDRTSQMQVNGQFETNDGSVTTVNGTLSAGDLDVDGGAFRGFGTIMGRSFRNNGDLLPGSSPGSLTLDVDEFIQGAGGRIVAEIAGLTPGEQYDQLIISGKAILAGTLELQLLEDDALELFRPEDGTVFQFVSATGGIEGEFDAVALNTPGILADLDVRYVGGTVAVTVVSSVLLGDFNGDDQWSVADIDLLSIAVASGLHEAVFDLTGDRLVNVNDVTEFLSFVRSLPGDADLDGTVAFGDFLVLSENFGNAGVWSQGDFDSDGTVGFGDFLVLSENFGQTPLAATPGALASVPEPKSSYLLWIGMLFPFLRRGLRAARNSEAQDQSGANSPAAESMCSL